MRNISAQTYETESQNDSKQNETWKTLIQFNDHIDLAPFFWDGGQPINFRKNSFDEEADIQKHDTQNGESDDNSPVQLFNQQVQESSINQEMGHPYQDSQSPPQRDLIQQQTTIQKQVPYNQKRVEDQNKTQNQESNKKKQKKLKQEPSKQQPTRGNQQNFNQYEQNEENLVPLYDSQGLLNIEDDQRENVSINIAQNSYQLNQQEKPACIAQIVKQGKTTKQKQQIVNPKTKKYKKQEKYNRKIQNQIKEQIPDQNYDEDQQDEIQQFQSSTNLNDLESKEKKGKGKILDKYKKLDNRYSKIDPNENQKTSIYEDKIQQYLGKQKYIIWPRRTNIKTIHLVFQQFSKIKTLMMGILLDKQLDTSKGEDGFYILIIIMGMIRYNYYTQLKCDNYDLGDIEWIYKLRDDLRNRFKIKEVQDALEYIYRFILNDEQILEGQTIINWKNLVEDRKRNYLGYQQEIDRNFYKSFCSNHYKYIQEFPYLKLYWNFEEKCYKLQDQREKKSNPDCGKKEFEQFDKKKLKSFMLNHYMRYYLNNKQKKNLKKPAIEIDSIFNLIAHHEGF